MELLIADADGAGNAFCVKKRFIIGIIIREKDFTTKRPRVASRNIHYNDVDKEYTCNNNDGHDQEHCNYASPDI